MEAIQLNHAARPHRYACAGITINPNPPQVGVVTTLGLTLKNAGPKPVTISRIETMIAQFGVGVAWEQLPALGPFHLPADPNYIEEVTMQWTPQKGGHRCVRANIHIETLPQPLQIGRNLQVIESGAAQTNWDVPFRLGNPQDQRMPIILEIGGNSPQAIDAYVMDNGRMVRSGEPIWLNAKEEVDAMLLLRARTNAALESVSTVEA
ncbi:MAG: hypothetical protein JOZ18_21360, partial [Chloroflexi bacterium]|nr:hypothetical protein [Chloroflexota bacterium]